MVANKGVASALNYCIIVLTVYLSQEDNLGEKKKRNEEWQV
jgi:hypothetical protein